MVCPCKNIIKPTTLVNVRIKYGILNKDVIDSAIDILMNCGFLKKEAQKKVKEVLNKYHPKNSQEIVNIILRQEVQA